MTHTLSWIEKKMSDEESVREMKNEREKIREKKRVKNTFILNIADHTKIFKYKQTIIK